MKNRFLTVLAALALFAQPVCAIDLSRLPHDVPSLLAWLRAPDRSLDPAYVFQPSTPWTVGMETSMIDTRARMSHDMTIIRNLPDGTVQVDHPSLVSDQQSPAAWKLGASLSYGKLSLGYGSEIFRRSPGKNTLFSFSYWKQAFGIQAQYYKVFDFVSTRYQAEQPDAAQEEMLLTSGMPALSRKLSLDAYYAFEHKRFAYTSAYKCDVIQRRSAGSWMLGAKYVQGDMRYNAADEAIIQFHQGAGCFTSQQFSLGGGYSYNWVPLHRQPAGEGLRGLRNLTLNATVMPLVTLLNHFQTIGYVYPDWETAVAVVLREKGRSDYSEDLASDVASYRRNHCKDGEKNRLNGRPSLSVITRMALCLNWNRFCVNASFQFNQLPFYGSSHNNWNQGDISVSDIVARGVFYDWMANLHFYVRF